MAPPRAPEERETSDDSAEAKNAATKSQGVEPQEKGSAAEPPKKKIISCIQCRRRKLKCDRAKPSCGTCARLQHQCVYPEGRMKSTTKRRNVKDLEARLAQVESLLNSEVSVKSLLNNGSTSAKSEVPSAMNASSYWNGVGMDIGMGNQAGNLSTSMPGMSIPILTNDAFSYDLIGFGLQEQLPSQEIIDELHQIYFERIHSMLPILHKYRYLSNVNLPPSIGIPVCLRYAVWALAASSSPKYSNHQEVFYQRARKYAEADEMKGQGEHFITVSHAQCWSLISNYEAENMYLSRAWLSAGRCVRLVQMMNLHRLDGEGESVKQMIAPPRDWTELEERRRIFWSAFCSDRYSCAGSGWPMSIEERDIRTNLPASEEAYEQGRMEDTTSLADAMNAEGASRISPYAGVVLMACLFGHNWLHLHRPSPDDHPEDVMKGKFWMRHRKMDHVISNTLMFLPDHLRLPGAMRNVNVICLNMNIHTSIICLHQAAILKAGRHKLPHQIIRHSQARCRMAAQEIVNILRLISHLDAAQLSNTWMSFNLYVAAGVLIDGCRDPDTGQQSRSNLDFLVTALQALGSKRAISKSFMTQLKIDLEVAGIRTSLSEPTGNAQTGGETRVLPSIYSTRGIISRVCELCMEVPNNPKCTSGCSAMHTGTDSSGASTNDSASPPGDYGHITMDGVLPKIRMNVRLRNDSEQRGYNNVNLKPSFFPPMRNEINPTTFNAPPTPIINQNFSGMPPHVYGQPQYNPNNYDRQNNFNVNSMGAKTANVPVNWNFDQFVPEVPTGYAGLQFPMQEGGDLNSLLNGGSWEDALFQK